MNTYTPIIIFLIMATLVSTPVKAQQTPRSAKITYFCTDWARDVPWDDFCKRVADAGFDGVETWVPGDATGLHEMMEAFRKYNLAYIFLCSGPSSDFETYLESYRQGLERAAALSPVRINSHTGKDHFSFEQNQTLIEVADSICHAHQIPIAHETHRGRFAFAAHITQEYLEQLPNLRLTLDISHWCAVHESMLHDQPDAVSLALQRTDHIHARVGHPQGPQVNDPRAPEWQEIVQRHLEWWDTIVAAHAEQNTPLTITTEFGPPDYLPTLPYTRQPVASQWDINKHMLNLLKSRYSN